jgi:hypothetical protein
MMVRKADRVDAYHKEGFANCGTGLLAVGAAVVGGFSASNSTGVSIRTLKGVLRAAAALVVEAEVEDCCGMVAVLEEAGRR